MSSFIFSKVYEVVKKIPCGKVGTYGQVANQLKINGRIVGWALHANKDSQVPCHRIVNREGRLAPGYAFGGPNVQKEKLMKEGVKFKDEGFVDLEKCIWEL